MAGLANRLHQPHLMRHPHFGLRSAIFGLLLAAGLAVPQPAAALPFETDIDPDEVVFNAINCDVDPENCGEEYVLDINGDGEDDLSFFHYIDDLGPYADVVGLGPSLGNSIWWIESEDFTPLANRFDEPTKFGETESLLPFAILFDDTCFCAGENPWSDGGVGYLGGIFEFLDNSFHQFWVAMSVDSDNGALTLLSAGWESDEFVFDQFPAEVPEPGTMSLLGLGAAGLAILRRRARR